MSASDVGDYLKLLTSTPAAQPTPNKPTSNPTAPPNSMLPRQSFKKQPRGSWISMIPATRPRSPQSPPQSPGLLSSSPTLVVKPRLDSTLSAGILSSTDPVIFPVELEASLLVRAAKTNNTSEEMFNKAYSGLKGDVTRLRVVHDAVLGNCMPNSEHMEALEKAVSQLDRSGTEDIEAWQSIRTLMAAAEEHISTACISATKTDEMINLEDSAKTGRSEMQGAKTGRNSEASWLDMACCAQNTRGGQPYLDPKMATTDNLEPLARIDPGSKAKPSAQRDCCVFGLT